MTILKTILLVIIIFTSCKLHAQYYIEKHYQSHKVTGNQLLITTDGGLIEIEAWNESVIRIGYHFDYKADLAVTPAVCSFPGPVKTTVRTTDSTIIYDTDSMTILIQKQPLMMNYYRNGKLLLKDTLFGFFYYEKHEYHGIKFAVESNENIYGCGSQADSINRRNFSRTLSQTNRWGYEWGNEYNLNFAVPFFVSSKNYGLYFDNHSIGLINIDVSNQYVFSYNSIRSKFSFFLISGTNQADVFNRYTDITGKQPLPPRWALGYIQSKAYYYTEDEVMAAVDDMIASDYPIDAVVLDATWYGGLDEMGNMTWGTNAFPNYKKLLSDYNDIGIKLIPITQMYISPKSIHYNSLHGTGLVCRDSNLQTLYCRIQKRDSFLIYDLTNPSTIEWWWELYKEQTKYGAAGWWCDGGEPDIYPETTLHHNGKSSYVMKNIMNFLWLQMLHDGYKKDFPDSRFFFMTRSGWAGAQRFGAFPLCGDEARSWLGLKAMIPVMLGASMSGISYLHSDIGGFAPLDQMTHDELYVRWYQLGVFSPVMRTHRVIPLPAEPCYYDENIQRIVKKLSHLRYSFLPYNYTLSYNNTVSGLPLMKPINFYEPGNDAISDVNDEFLWGDALLVAPVVAPVLSRSLVLPSGKWFDWFTGESFIGGDSTYKIDVPLDKLPLYVRAGAIIPTALKMSNTKSYKADSLLVYYFPDTSVAASSFRMFNDDGLNPKSLELGLYEFIDFKAKCSPGEIVFELDHIMTDVKYCPAGQRDINVCIRGIPFTPGTLLLDGRHVNIVHSFDLVNPRHVYAVYLENYNEFWVHFPWKNEFCSMTLSDIIDSVERDVRFPVLSVSSFVPNPHSRYTMLEYSLNSPDALQFTLYDTKAGIVGQWDAVHDLPGVYGFRWSGELVSGAFVGSGSFFLVIRSIKTNQVFIRTLIRTN